MEGEEEILERAHSIVRKALSAISEEKDDVPMLETKDQEHHDDLQIDDIMIGEDDDPEGTTQDKSLIETAITLTETVLSAAVSRAQSAESLLPDDSTTTSNVADGQVVERGGKDHDDSDAASTTSSQHDRLAPDQDSGSFISLHSTHSLKIPSAEPLLEEEVEEEEVVERREETRAEFVTRKNFENFTEYTKQLNGKERLSEKRFLQMMRELGLVGPGTRMNTTDAEIVYFKNTQHRSRGMTMEEYKASLETMLQQNSLPIDSICEEVLYPAVPVHHFQTVFMSVK